LIDQDDWPELKKLIKDREKYEARIEADVQRVINPEIVIKYTSMIDD
jgi:hypothetical protein